MLFQETTPDTSGYMIAGYAIAFIVMALYVASIYLRMRNLSQDVQTLEEMDQPAEPVKASSARQPAKDPARPGGSRPAKAANTKTRKNY